MTREEQQAIFDAIRERSDRPGTFNTVNGVRLTALCEIGKACVGKECRSRWSPYH